MLETGRKVVLETANEMQTQENSSAVSTESLRDVNESRQLETEIVVNCSELHKQDINRQEEQLCNARTVSGIILINYQLKSTLWY